VNGGSGDARATPYFEPDRITLLHERGDGVGDSHRGGRGQRRRAPFDVRKAVEKVEIQAVLEREAQDSKRRNLTDSDDLLTSLLHAVQEQEDGIRGVAGGRREA
jgi:hypothetical protein